jgi:hypothetical protein
MIAKIEQFARQFRLEAGQRADAVLSSLRKATENTADFIASGKTPIRKLADTGIKLNRVSHKGFEKLVRNQASLLEGTLDDGAARLKLAARADSFRALVGDQLASLPSSRERTIGTARKSLDIVVDTGTEIRGIVQGAIGDLRPARPVTERITAQPAVKKATRKASATRKRVAKQARATTKPVARKARTATKTAKARARTAQRKAGAAVQKARKSA